MVWFGLQGQAELLLQASGRVPGWFEGREHLTALVPDMFFVFAFSALFFVLVAAKRSVVLLAAATSKVRSLQCPGLGSLARFRHVRQIALPRMRADG